MMPPLQNSSVPSSGFHDYTDMRMNMNMGSNMNMGNNMNMIDPRPVINQMETLDVTISVGFLRGIFMHENSKVRDWQHQHQTELDSVKIAIIARNDANNLQADQIITSSPLEKPKQVGDWMNYSALFPLKGPEKVTKMTLPGLIQRDHSIDGGFSSHGQYKRESIELLITLIFGNEAITLGKARLVVTGEELRTKQSDLPIDISRDGILKSQKKSHFPMKRMTNLPRGKNDELSPVSFKYDRRRRKFQLETDAVLRVFYKVSPHDPYRNPINSNMSTNMMNTNFSVSGQSFLPRKFGGGGQSVRSRSTGPRRRSGDVPSTVGILSEPPPRKSMIGSMQDQQSSVRRPPTAQSSPPAYIHGNDYFTSQSVMGGSIHSGINQGPFMQRHQMHGNPSIHGAMHGSPSIHGSMYGNMNDLSSIQGSFNGNYFGGVSPGRTGPPSSPISMAHRSHSAPRMRYSGGYGDLPNAYGGSSFGYGGGNNNMSRNNGSRRSHGKNPNVHGGVQTQYSGGSYNAYGGSSYGSPRKDQSYGGMMNNRSRSQSPYVSRI